MSADRIFINAGTRPAVPGLEGLSRVPFLDSTSIMELDEVPEHLLVLGGGYVGLEFGQMFRRFGSRVTVAQAEAQLLGREDRDVASEIATILRDDGIEILLNAKAERVHRDDRGITLTVRTPDGPREATGSHLLVATGRTPNTDSLNVAAAGIATDERGFIRVNDALETTRKGVFALGDITGGPAFTHIAYDDYRILRTNLLDGGRARTKGRPVPYAVFIDPELGRIGLTETEARASCPSVRVARLPMAKVARALEIDEPRGFIKAVVDGESQRVLGAAVLGTQGGELMTMIQLAMMGDLAYTTLRDGIFAHPTVAESLNNLFSHFDD
jgi:pyruvate/2-oxoglutarate dehydrogenase complex dihydrolipoamide dehydrogenase (E3) component